MPQKLVLMARLMPCVPAWRCRRAKGLVFTRLGDVRAAARQVADGHLLIAASRAGHLFAGATNG